MMVAARSGIRNQGQLASGERNRQDRRGANRMSRSNLGTAPKRDRIEIGAQGCSCGISVLILPSRSGHSTAATGTAAFENSRLSPGCVRVPRIVPAEAQGRSAHRQADTAKVARHC